MRIVRFFFAATLFAMLLVSTAKAQNTSPARDKFFAYFTEVYLELSKPPLLNYYENLNNTIALSFSNENKTFIPALMELATKYKISEEDAADSLYQYSLRKLVAEKFWVTFGDVYKEYNQAFKAYSDALCPCITEKLKPTDFFERLSPVLQECIARIVIDSTTATNIRLYAGDKTMNEIFRKQQYFSMYLYQNCNTVKQALNQLLRSEAYSSYASVRTEEKGNRAKNILRYYRDKKMDSLALVFPTYKKFTSELNDAVALLKTKGANSSAYSLTEDNNVTAVVNFFTTEGMLGDMVTSFASNAIYAPVTKLSFQKMEPRKEPNGDRIEEIKEDTTTPVKQ